MHILVVDDDQELVDMVYRYLPRDRWRHYRRLLGRNQLVDPIRHGTHAV